MIACTGAVNGIYIVHVSHNLNRSDPISCAW